MITIVFCTVITISVICYLEIIYNRINLKLDRCLNDTNKCCKELIKYGRKE